MKKNVPLVGTVPTVFRNATVGTEKTDAVRPQANASAQPVIQDHNASKCAARGNTDQVVRWNASVTTVAVATLSAGHAFAPMDGSELHANMLAS